MRVSITFDYVRSTWEITVRQDGRFIITEGKTQHDCFLNLQDEQLVNQIKLWFNIQ